MKLGEGYKIWRGIDFSFQNRHKEYDTFWPEHSKLPKIVTLMGSLWAKYILFELKKYRGVIFHETGRGIQNLERNRLLISKLAEGI